MKLASLQLRIPRSTVYYARLRQADWSECMQCTTGMFSTEVSKLSDESQCCSITSDYVPNPSTAPTSEQNLLQMIINFQSPRANWMNTLL
jgi:hypothetical protein